MLPNTQLRECVFNANGCLIVLPDNQSFDEQLDEEAVKLITEADNLVSAATQELEEGDEPTQEDVVMYTENITKKIQELLLNAQAGRHSWLVLSVPEWDTLIWWWVSLGRMGWGSPTGKTGESLQLLVLYVPSVTPVQGEGGGVGVGGGGVSAVKFIGFIRQCVNR